MEKFWSVRIIVWFIRGGFWKNKQNIFELVGVLQLLNLISNLFFELSLFKEGFGVEKILQDVLILISSD